MNQEKIGKFIAENRKSKKITQSELAEKLGVTDRAISNWENGKNMPDLSLFKPLCDILDITINELISGEKINNKEYNEKLEENLINTIDYIDKKKNNTNNIKSISILILGILGLFLSQFITNNNQEANYINIVSMILTIYSIKQLSIKYKWFRKIIAILLILICIIIITLNQ